MAHLQRGTFIGTKKVIKETEGGVDYDTYMAPNGTAVHLVSTDAGHCWPGSGQPIRP